MTCEHLRKLPVPEPAGGTQGCEECLKIGQTWVHLRKCLICGHVGCCDQSIGKHATAHFHQTHHPVMRSAEPGELWKYCYIDDTYA
jgi:monovalent cation/hydrogen antiporter